jgi:thioredoxin 1
MFAGINRGRNSFFKTNRKEAGPGSSGLITFQKSVIDSGDSWGPIRVMSKCADVTDDDFQAEVLDSDRPVMVDFWAEWCGPCRLVAREVDVIHEKLGEQLKVVKLDIDANPRTTVNYGVMSIPTLMLFVDGQERRRVVGARPAAAIMAEIQEFMPPAPVPAES